MNASAHPVVVECAVRECFKRRTPRTAALTTQKKLAGSPNLFIGGGTEVVEIDPQELENQIWFRMADRTIKAIKSVKPGFEEFALEGILAEYGQKPSPANKKQLQMAIDHQLNQHGQIP